ncbi:acetoin dehydrogenase dihydrolipoyllysine-residue acetyltransferase subunit [Ancylobacter rudongensis]|uniref:Pyruvate dehydrogenase E2 component (Dihydrolipoamide acetyltransferase) n=1 Tax=Ancylobacter rudongensis TaxID=177413 RepID=A0A1G4SD23_9HYPH|nr:acetoin dehydrogenase dihydrolipoyllysine-residue acetyltransferase subunit [Ancylobacter rudongensis]SCW66956.1 pyruvate dehydrogenase E2 component (dihydrolipoamide acetyltransferase) [Ancylobacter rudongensis]
MTDITVVGAGGEYMESVVVVSWHKTPGEYVAAGELVVTVETAKAATEIEAPVSGILADIRAQIGEEVAIGTVLGTIRDGTVESAPATAAPTAAAVPAAPAAPALVPVAPPVATARPTRINASPLARRIAASRGIDLSAIVPSSPSGRIKLRDVEAVDRAREAPERHSVASGPTSPAPSISLTRRGSGSRTPFVFLHGFGADGFSWQPLLATLGADHAAVLVDLPGHGRSPALSNAGSFEDLASAVAQALTETGIGECHLVGHSLGGGVAIALAETGRVALRSLTLIAPAGLGPEIDGDFLDGFCRATRAESLRPWLLRLFADPSIVSPGYVQATLKARGEDHRRAQTTLADRLFPDGTQAWEMRAALRRVAVAQKIIWGECDRIIPMRHALGAGPETAIHLLPHVGHMPHVEAPATVARLILQNARCAGRNGAGAT